MLEYSKIKVREFTGLSTFQFLAYFRRAIVYTFLAIYLGSLGLSTTEVTLMATVGMIANTGTQSFLWGKLLDRIRKPTEFVVIGEIIAGFSHLFMVFGYTFFLEMNQLILAGYVIIFSLGFIEIFWSMSNVGWSTLISELTEFDERKMIMGQFSIIGGFGGIGGAYLGGLLFEDGAGFANGSLFYIAATIMIFSSLIVFFSIRFKPEVREDVSVDSESSSDFSLSELPSELRAAILIFLVALVFINFGRNSIAIISSLFIAEPTAFGAGGEAIAFYRNVGGVATMIAGVFIGSVVAKTDDNKIMVSGVLMAAGGIFWLIFAPSLELALLSSFLIGASQAVIEASSYSIVAKMAPQHYRGRLFAYYNTTFFLSWGVAATLVAGPVADILIASGYSVADGYRGSFFVAIILIVIGIVILWRSFRYIRDIKELRPGSVEVDVSDER